MHRLREEVDELRARDLVRDDELRNLKAKLEEVDGKAVTTSMMGELAQEIGSVVNDIEAKLSHVNVDGHKSGKEI